MALTKNNIQLPFAAGLDQKTDPWQLSPGRFLALDNMVFSKAGALQKRNGFGNITSLPSDASATTLTTFNGNLTAIGRQFYAYSQNAMSWVDTGRIQPVQLSVQPVIRADGNQSSCDIAVASNGLACTTFLDGDGEYKYSITDTATGQALVTTTSLPTGSNAARVNVLGRFFVITFLVEVASTPHLQYIAIPLSNLSNPTPATDISDQVGDVATSGYDAVVVNNALYVAWDGSDVGGAVQVSSLDSNLAQGTTIAEAGISATLVSITSDTTGNTPVVWVGAYDGTDAYAMAYSSQLDPILAPTQFLSAATISQLTSVASNSLAIYFYQVEHTYSYGSERTDYVAKKSVNDVGTIGLQNIVARSVGLASKAFNIGNINYFLTAYPNVYQPTYLLIDEFGDVVARFASANGGGYITTQVLPSVSIQGNVAQMGYLFKDLLSSVNKKLDPTSVAGIYSQTGVNLAALDLSSTELLTAEIGGSVYIAGGFLWQYDGVKPVEQGFHVWPDNVDVTTSATGGLITAQQYFYQVTFEWTDAAGNIHRSAPSIPVSVTTTGSTSSNTINVPTLRLTYKVAPNEVRICIYRWSVAQETFYQVTSVASPTLNNPSVDSIAFVDTLADSSIVGNSIIYTNGGVVENLPGPACTSLALYKSRLIAIDAENRNLIWFSKQVIESTPVEMSDLFTRYIAPTTGAQGSTGSLTALSALDDKLILAKANAFYYQVGEGPDNTGANNDFSEPQFITSTVGTINQKSFAFMPSGLLFQSNKGIWLLGRDLSTSYIGAPVENYNDNTVISALTIPGTNQVRLQLDNGIALVYDYYFQQWGTFSSMTGISATLFQDKHTYLDRFNRVYQETPGLYVDGGLPVLMSFATGWFNLAGVQGLERAYEFYMLGHYYSPHLLNVTIAYDYNDSPPQNVLITPDNYSEPYGVSPAYGQSTPYGGPGYVEQWQVYFSQQKCQSFQLSVSEAFNPIYGTTPGAGLSFSGINLSVGGKKQRPNLAAKRSVG